VITDAGFLELHPTPKMNDFDFLLATPTVPKPNRPLTAKQIASRMIEKNYSCYFTKNKRNSIKTFQDFEIEALLNN